MKVNDNAEYLSYWEIDTRITESPLSLRNFAISSCENITVFAILPKALRDTRIDVSSITDSQTGNGLLHMVVLADHDGYMKRWGESEEEWSHDVERLLNLLLDGGCNLSSRNDEGHTPLSLALEQHE